MGEKLILAAFVVVFLMGEVSGFGVATLYSDSYPLRMQPGQSKETFFLLSNVVEGDSDVVINSDLIDGDEVASLVNANNRYSVPFGVELEVPVVVQIPENAVPGTEYRVRAMFKPVPTEVEGVNIQFLVNIGKSFPVVVISDEREEESGIYTLTLEENPEDVIRELSPPSKIKVNVFFGIILFLVVGILAAILFIMVLLVKRRRRVEVGVAGFVNQVGGVQGGNYVAGTGQ
jgi:hypothetical protein